LIDIIVLLSYLVKGEIQNEPFGALKLEQHMVCGMIVPQGEIQNEPFGALKRVSEIFFEHYFSLVKYKMSPSGH